MLNMVKKTDDTRRRSFLKGIIKPFNYEYELFNKYVSKYQK